MHSLNAPKAPQKITLWIYAVTAANIIIQLKDMPLSLPAPPT